MKYQLADHTKAAKKELEHMILTHESLLVLLTVA